MCWFLLCLVLRIDINGVEYLDSIINMFIVTHSYNPGPFYFIFITHE
jgi:hypothetical protein